jgi:spermidine synthase
MSLRGLADDSADVVIGDAFSGATVPWHLTTVEFNREIRRVLTPGGVYAMNVIDYGSREFARSAAATLEEVFSHVALFAPDSYIDGSGGGNYVLVGSESPIDVAAIEGAIRSRDGTERGSAGSRLATFIDGAELLVDDFAPVDQMVGRPSG